MRRGRTKKTRTNRPALGGAPTRADSAQVQEPAAGSYEIDSGNAELIPDDDNSSGWLLRINGVQSSHIDLADPLRLEFEYMRWMAALIEASWSTEMKIRVLHLGGGACSMARYLAAAYAGARQVVVEIDGRLAELVRGWFDIPRAPLVRIRVGEARAVTEALSPGSRDLLIRDVFSGPLTPAPLTTREFTEQARRVLSATGIYLVNCGDTADLVRARREVATIGAVFQHTAMIADPPMLKGRRHGNIVIAGSNQPLEGSPGLVRALLAGAVPAQYWDDARARQFAAGAPVLTDTEVGS